jgi:hypothetical protein
LDLQPPIEQSLSDGQTFTKTAITTATPPASPTQTRAAMSDGNDPKTDTEDDDDKEVTDLSDR